MNVKIKKTLNALIREKTVPELGTFELSDVLISRYVEVYGELNSNKQKGLGKASNISQARKLAAMNLHRLRLSRLDRIKNEKETRINVKEGYVYLISNPAFPDYYKVGMTSNLEKRLRSYQTGDPYRAYKIEKFSFVFDMRDVEKTIFKKYSLVREGEWLKKDLANIAFSEIVKGV